MTLRATNPPTNEGVAVQLPYPYGFQYPMTVAGDVFYTTLFKTLTGNLYLTATTFPDAGSPFTWAWFDKPLPTQFDNPTSFGSSTFGSDGSFSINIRTNLPTGQLGFLIITNCITNDNCRSHAMPTPAP